MEVRIYALGLEHSFDSLAARRSCVEIDPRIIQRELVSLPLQGPSTDMPHATRCPN